MANTSKKIRKKMFYSYKNVLIHFKAYFSSNTFMYTPKSSNIQIHVIHMVRKCHKAHI